MRGTKLETRKTCATHLIDRVVFMRLRSIHIHDEIESLNDPTEAVLDEFWHHRSLHNDSGNFNDITADDYLRGIGVTNVVETQILRSDKFNIILNLARRHYSHFHAP